MKIAIIGAGPRGIAVTDRLIAKANQENINIDITLFDPYSISGRVWDPAIKLNHSLIMNTIVDQISFFADNSIHNPGPIRQGPNFYEWIQQLAPDYLKQTEVGRRYLDKIALTKNDFAVRGLAGLYEQWFFEDVKKQVASNSSIGYLQKEIQKINQFNDQFKLDFSAGSENFDFVFMALGYSDTHLNDEERRFSDFAKRDNLIYVAPGHPSEADLSKIPAEEAVIIRGLGLSFFDYMSLLTEGRGGKFVETEKGQLIYEPSGKEPIIFAGSRRGLPLHARGINQKEANEEYKPRFFTENNLKNLKNASGKIDYTDFFDLFDKEIQYKHYENLIRDPEFNNLIHKREDRFFRELRRTGAGNYAEIAKNYHIPEKQIWDWHKILHAASIPTASDNFKDWYLNYLDEDIADASKGNKKAPYAGAFDITRDVRNTIRNILEDNYFSLDDLKRFLSEFNSISTLISVGPPVIRIKQLRALIACHIVNMMGPNIHIENDPRNKSFFASSQRPETVNAKNLIEARLPSNNNDLANQALRVSLNEHNWFHKTTFSNNDQYLVINAAQINPKTYQVINRNGQIVADLYSAGIPHEDISWFTTILPRPGVNTIIYKEAAIISEQIINDIKKRQLS